MKLVWSPETALKAYIDTVKSCEKFKESGVPELLSAMAAGFNTKLIVESWCYGGPIAASVGLAVAARNTGARHVCIVPDEKSRVRYIEALAEMGVSPPPEVVAGEAEAAVSRLAGLDFLVVDCKRREFARVLRVAKVSPKGAVLACKNAWQRNSRGGFRWSVVLQRGVRVVRSVFLPVGKGLDIAYIGSRSGAPLPPPPQTTASNGGTCRWIKHIDQQSGEEHLFRE
ncbi:S-adenosyl-L-methionine-dependent methyltransferase [Vigna unguiculata]|uniref:S-adenosyl-L-methionine-dependent methyltransferase n=2 Tax=Vigna unguiculata TaxID=3917 RepID=A0A4D6MNA5_VIGUN|nr:S-adenosyl-L-methionine-dependent methyltransferase [Vigna unguiculata]